MADGREEVLLVGLGNIGFRHLQGLAPLVPRIRLAGVDPSAPARERAAAEWARLGGEVGSFVGDLDALDRCFATAVVATSATGRLTVLRAVLPRVTGPRLIIEKVAFTSIAELQAARALLAEAGKAALVNCARRMWPMYAALREHLAGGRIAISVRGRGIGLGSNGVHFIDLLQHLSREAALSVTRWEGGEVVPSKRQGYWEAFGRLEVTTVGGSSLVLSVMPDDPERIAIRITSATHSFAADEAAGEIAGLDGWAPARPPYQSELTGAAVAALLDGTAPSLPTLDESAASHAALLGVLGPHLAAAGVDVSAGVPIT